MSAKPIGMDGTLRRKFDNEIINAETKDTIMIVFVNFLKFLEFEYYEKNNHTRLRSCNGC